jgi:hypothetical protein
MLTPGVRRVLDRLADVPVAVYDRSWQLLEQNARADALLGEPGAERNLARVQFVGAPSRVVLAADEVAPYEAWLVEDLHRTLARFPHDPRLRGLITGLMGESERVRSLWKVRPSDGRLPARVTIAQPAGGAVTLDRDLLRVDGSDERLLVYSGNVPEPG